MSEPLIKAIVERITPLTDTILQLILAPQKYIEYEAGQYLQIISKKEALCYSIANAPLGSHTYELHIRHSPENLTTQRLLDEIKQHGFVYIKLPLGTCYLSQFDPIKPLLFIAGGTGFAPIKAMIEQLLTHGNPRPFELFWSARSQSDLYMDDQVIQWQTHVPNFKYFSLLSETSKASLADTVLARHHQDIHQWQMIMSGPFDMVYSTRDLLLAQGISKKNIFSDAFSFEGCK